MTHHRIPGPVGDLHVDDGGEGKTVVFIHALAGATTHWAPQLEFVRQTGRAVALDLRGHGRSDTTEDAEYSLEAYASDVAAVVDALSLDMFTLVGHSLGGGVAIAYAAEHPDLVTGLLLVDPVGDQRLAPPDATAEFLAALTESYRITVEAHWKTILEGARPEVVERVMEDLELTPRRVVIESLRRLSEYDLTTAVTRCTGQRLTLITHLNEYPFSLHMRDPALGVRRIEGVSHWAQLDEPQAVNELLTEYRPAV